MDEPVPVSADRNELMSLDDLLRQCLRHFVHLDHSNAAVHCAEVRYSPLTFRLAEEIGSRHSEWGYDELADEVLSDRGEYPEDAGR